MNKEEMQDIKERLDLRPDNMNKEAQEGYYKLFDYIEQLQQENKQLKEKYENIISRFRFIKNRVNQGMIEKYKNESLLELGNNILQELEKGDNNGNN